MKKINRRSFVGTTMLGLGSTIVSTRLVGSILPRNFTGLTDLPIGFQSWTVKEMLAKDFPGTLKAMVDLGYQLIELCSPAGYEKIGFGFLTGMKTKEIKRIIQDAGLQCPSSHFGKAEFTPEKLDKSIEFASEMGMSQMICSTFWLPKNATLKDYDTECDRLNKAAEKIKSAGMATGFHNHEMEFAYLEGTLIYDAMLSRFDPGLVKMQFQTEVINLGYKASAYFNQYPGRFISAHLSDWTADKKEAAVGQGIINWKEFFASLQSGGVKNIFVEMNFDKFKDSAVYIRG